MTVILQIAQIVAVAAFTMFLVCCAALCWDIIRAAQMADRRPDDGRRE
jgi:hypothetical protein